MTRTELGWDWLGIRPYPETLQLQEDLVERRRAGEIEDTVLLLEHPSTYTLGRRSTPGEIGDPERHRSAGIDVCETPRGGGVTWHGPGQLVAYPIIDLGRIGSQPDSAVRIDVAGFVAALERAMAASLGEWGVEGRAIDGLTGIWTGDPRLDPDRCHGGARGRRDRRRTGQEDRLDRPPGEQGHHEPRDLPQSEL